MKFLVFGLCLALSNALPQGNYNYQGPPAPVKTLAPSSPLHIPPVGSCCQELALLRAQGRILNSNSVNSIHGSAADKGFNYQNSLGSNSINGHFVVSEANKGSQFSSNGFGVQQTAGGYGSTGGHKQVTLLIQHPPPPAQSGFKPISNPSTQYIAPSQSQHEGFGQSQTSSGYISTSGSQKLSQISRTQDNEKFSTATSQGLNGIAEGLTSSSYATTSLSGAASDRITSTAKLSGYDYGSPSTQFSGASSQNVGIASDVGTNVEKHIYVHVPPDDISEASERHQQQQLQQLIQPKKHYKIIFIKAPTTTGSSPNYAQMLANQGGLSQEKTLVYVLVKKPDEPSYEEIQKAIQNSGSQQINKPEVFFIKYKTRKDQLNQFGGNYAGTDLGVDIRHAGSSSENNLSTSSSFTNEISDSVNQVPANTPAPVYGPPSPTPASVYGVPNIK